MTQALDVSTRNFIAGTSVPGAYSGDSKASEMLAKLMRLHPHSDLFAANSVDLSTPRSLLLDFRKGLFLKENASAGQLLSYPAFWAMSEVTRTSKAWSPNWSGRSGDPVGQLIEYAANELRGNTPPNCGPGALIETAGASNEVPNPRCEGALPGPFSSGLPEGWTRFENETGCAGQIVGRGVENGWPYLEIEYSGTATGGVSELRLCPLQSIAATAGDDFCGHVGLRLVAGSLTGVSAIRHQMYSFNNGGGAISQVSDATLATKVDSTHRRFVVSKQSISGTLTHIVDTVRFDFTASASVDFRVRIFLPQVEDGLLPTSPVLPEIGTPAASTRAADVRSGGLDFQRSSWGSHLDWDGTNGGAVNGFVEFMPNTPCHVPGKTFQPQLASSNEIRNPRGEGASGSTPPTHWQESGTSGLTRTWSSGSDGLGPYAQLVLSGTAASQSYNVRLETLDEISCGSGDPFTLSVGVQVISGDLTAISAIRTRLLTRSSAPANRDDELETISVDRQPRRFRQTLESADASSVAITPMLVIDAAASGTISVTLRFRLPQCENLLYTTNPILPTAGTPAVVTRWADYVDLDGSDWAPASGEPFSLAVSAVLPRTPSDYNYEALFEYGDDANNAIRMGMDAVSQGEGRVVALEASSVVVASNLGGVSTAGKRYRVAFAWEQNDFYATSGGDAVSESLDDSIAAHTYGAPSLSLGGRLGAAVALTCQIERFEFAPGQWSDAEVDALAL